MSSEVKVPTLGESVSEATIGEWLKQPGDAVKLDEPIASLETDKVAIEVTATVAGILGQLLAKVGDITPLERFRLRVLLALISRPEAKLLIVDDIDQVRDMKLRKLLLSDLRGVAVHLPVMVNTVNEEGL